MREAEQTYGDEVYINGLVAGGGNVNGT